MDYFLATLGHLVAVRDELLKEMAPAERAAFMGIVFILDGEETGLAALRSSRITDFCRLHNILLVKTCASCTSWQQLVCAALSCAWRRRRVPLCFTRVCVYTCVCVRAV